MNRRRFFVKVFGGVAAAVFAINTKPKSKYIAGFRRAKFDRAHGPGDTVYAVFFRSSDGLYELTREGVKKV